MNQWHSESSMATRYNVCEFENRVNNLAFSDSDQSRIDSPTKTADSYSYDFAVHAALAPLYYR